MTESDSVSVKSSQHAAGVPAGSRSPKTTPATPSSSVSPGDDQSRLSGRRQRSTRRGHGSSGCRRQTFRRSLGLHGDHRGAAGSGSRRPVGAQRVTQEPHKSLPRGVGVGGWGGTMRPCVTLTHTGTHTRCTTTDKHQDPQTNTHTQRDATRRQTLQLDYCSMFALLYTPQLYRTHYPQLLAFCCCSVRVTCNGNKGESHLISMLSFFVSLNNFKLHNR